MQRAKWIQSALFLAAGTVLLAVLALIVQPQAVAPRGASALTIPYQTIGLPDAGTLALQYINVLGLSEPTSTTVRFLAPNGSVVQNVTEPSAPAESLFLYTGPDRPDDLARAEYTGSPAGGNLVFGVNYELTGMGNSAYLGFDMNDMVISRQEAYRIQIPLQMKDLFGWTSAFVLQNRMSEFAANVAVSFYDQDGNWVCTYYDSLDIPAAGSTLVHLGNVGCLPSGFNGSAVVSSDQPVAVSSVKNLNTTYGVQCAYRGVESSETAYTLAAPALFKGHDLQTSTLCIQNAGVDDAIVWVDYSDGLAVDPAVVAPFAVYCLNQGGEGHAPGWTGGAIIQGTEPLAAVVQVLAQDQGALIGCWAYTATSPASLGRQEDNALAMPVLFSHANGWTSEVHLYNLGGGPAEITPRYVSLGSRFVYCAQSFTLPEGAAISFSQADLPAFIDQAMAYFNTSQPVAAAVSATSSQPLGATDRHFGYRVAYVGGQIPFPDTCDEVRRVFVPVVLKEKE